MVSPTPGPLISAQPSRKALTLLLLAVAVALALILAGFWVTGAFNSSSHSKPSGAPGAPVGVTEVAATTASATIAWQAPLGTVTSYNVLDLSPWVSGCRGNYSVYASGVLSTSEEMTNWGGAGYQVCVEVEALNGTQVGPASTPIAVATLASSPTGFEATGASTSSITLSWSAPPTYPDLGVLTGYQIFVTEGEGGPVSCGIWSPATAVGLSTSYTVGNLTEDGAFCFEVAAVDAGGLGDPAELGDAETLGPPGQATNAQNGVSVVATQPFSVVSGQLMLVTVSSYGPSWAQPVVTTQNGQTFGLVASDQNPANIELWTYVFEAVASLTTSQEVLTLTDTYSSQYMLGVVAYSGYTAVYSVGTWENSTNYTDTGSVVTVAGATLVACIGYVTDISTRSFSTGYTEATWGASTINSRADQWYDIDAALAGTNSGTVTRGLAGVTTIVLLALVS